MKHSAILTALLSMAATGLRAQEPPMDDKIVTSGEAKVRADVTLVSVLQIGLGSGAESKNNEGADVLTLDFNSAEGYEKGIFKRVDKQLSVFAMGSGGYVVDAELHANNPESEALYKLLRLDVVGAGSTGLEPKAPAQQLRVHTTPRCIGAEELDAGYAIDPLEPENTDLINELVGKKLSVDISYTIAPL